MGVGTAYMGEPVSAIMYPSAHTPMRCQLTNLTTQTNGGLMQNKRMADREIVAEFPVAMKEGHIFIHYQPQYNHCTGRITGAEALMRWEDPEHGRQFPNDFIPVLEEQGLIVVADLFIFDQICRFQKRCIDEGMRTVPVSFNVSRLDLADGAYLERLEEIRRRHDVPVELLRAEITESSAVGGLELVASSMRWLHDHGYVVEMDDFGAGYSSLNILKDLPFDIMKLDMAFLRGDLSGRGGVIVNALVQMAKWLETPVIAEGVETREQADFMASIGCTYIQGYFYSRPLPDDEFRDLIQHDGIEPTVPEMTLIDTMNAKRFWSPDSLETLIFSNYVGAACILSYSDGKANILRINHKYVQELGMNVSATELVHSDPWGGLDGRNREVYESTVKLAMETGEEQTCETWRAVTSDCCGDDRICIRSTMRVVGRTDTEAILYVMIQNVTAEKRRFDELSASERRFRFASEQSNTYAWEYDIGTHEMRPCFRCMRDLGLPPVVRDYPEPAIDAGIFPPDYADMYRGWMRQLEEGVGTLEGIIPLTVGRVPFHVRYTTEFDETGRPLKAYGSATLVVDGEDMSDGSEGAPEPSED